MAKQCSIMDIENLRGLFNKIMQAHQLKPEDVKKDRSKIWISHIGQFQCANCQNLWHSKFSWITFDLIELKITYRWKMKCKICYTMCQPTFTVEQIEMMFDTAVCWYKGEDLPQQSSEVRFRRRDRLPPHLPELCEKCQWGCDQCWTHRWYNLHKK